MFANLQAKVKKAVEKPARGIARSGVSPNTLTVVGFIITCVAAYYLSQGAETLAALIILIAGLFDMFDGAVARVANRSSKFGAFLDSTIDRYCEAVLFLGVLYYALQQGSNAEAIATYIVIVGSILVSYTRARAEGLGLSCQVGILGRPERVILLAFGLFIHQLFWILIILGVLTHYTTIQRIYHVWRQTSIVERQ